VARETASSGGRIEAKRPSNGRVKEKKIRYHFSALAHRAHACERRAKEGMKPNTFKKLEKGGGRTKP